MTPSPPSRRGAGRARLAMLATIIGAALGGCAGTGDPRDPFEGMNRAVYAFNDAVDSAVLEPVGRAYRAVMPDPLDHAVTNFFRNLGDVAVAVNDLLQLKLTEAVEDGARVAINSTIGLLGFIDIASGLGIEKNNEDFGQTLGAWGIDGGPYLVLPFLGPSSLRDAVGLAVDTATFDPVFYVDDVPLRNGLFATRLVDRRADLLGAEKIVGEAALDEYIFIRDVYLQRRENLVGDVQ